MSGCVCSAPVDQCAPALINMWPITAPAWRGRHPHSPHSVSLLIRLRHAEGHEGCKEVMIRLFRVMQSASKVENCKHGGTDWMQELGGDERRGVQLSLKR